MRLEIIDTNKGQCPATVKEALKVSGLSYSRLRTIIKHTSENRSRTICFTNGCNMDVKLGWDFELVVRW